MKELEKKTQMMCDVVHYKDHYYLSRLLFCFVTLTNFSGFVLFCFVLGFFIFFWEEGVECWGRGLVNNVFDCMLLHIRRLLYTGFITCHIVQCKTKNEIQSSL